ncbi:GntR family transcriptional regulator [Micromonospora parathelypteridis]|uniref:DNA-binding GntR family transcriptional regulator n=1 Tax=Micromonospora parathelypteridis TaxID=1839617 RepID=A0A840W6L7_9ACTN|nr:GntR family transcriptional regulator [Micromonospora parathelypteridis]MBB5480708.1 DNA-binding GntR family transcriptional regulator [Micromonospora parathelypteridis]
MAADVYARLRDDIISGELEAGAPLVVTTVATRLGVSRTPVREALRLLTRDGLVESSERQLRVAGRSAQALFDIYEVRIPLEAAAARGAAERHTSFDRMQLIRLHEILRDVPPDDVAALNAANRKFHEAIWAATHNSALIDFLKRLDLYLRRYPATALHHAGRYQDSRDEHEALLEAILARDVEVAGERANVHFSAARDVRLRFYDSADPVFRGNTQS